MTEKKKSHLLSCRGEGYVDVAVSVLLILAVVLFALEIFSFLSLQFTLDAMAKEVAEAAAVRGGVDERVTELWNRLCQEEGMNPSLSFDGTTYFSRSSGQVQYGEQIMVTIHYPSGIFGMTITAKASSLSRVYHKGEGT